MNFIWQLVLLYSLFSGSIVRSCQFLVPVEFLNGCIFDRLAVTSSQSGLVVNGQSCNIGVDKDEFTMQPNIYFGNADDSKTYTIITLDPDAPNHGPGQFYLHWIVANVPGYSLKQGVGLTIGDTIIEYLGPDPPAFSGAHRYMIFAYLQTDNCVNLTIPMHRSRFDLMDWIQSFGGDNVLRGPVASVGFMTIF